MNSSKDPAVFLEHILESIRKIEGYTEGISKHEFLKSNMVQDAVIRNLEIIGEATKNISKNFREKHPEIVWRRISGFRDVLIRMYFGIDLDLTWAVVKKDLPALEEELSKMLKDERVSKL